MGWALGNPILNWAGSTTTGNYNWTREDLPAGPGVDNTIPEHFVSYCVDLNEFVNGSVSHTFEVITPEAHGFSAAQILLLSRLWGGFQNLTVDANSAAAFQVAIYEIQRDPNNINLSAGNFILQDITNNQPVKDKANEWLAQVVNMNVSLPTPELVVLAKLGTQDQITVRVPAPGSAVLGVAGAGLLAARRRRR